MGLTLGRALLRLGLVASAELEQCARGEPGSQAV